MASRDPTPPEQEPLPWYRRTWSYSNQPYRGCGCLYVLIVLLLIWGLLTLLNPAVALWPFAV